MPESLAHKISLSFIPIIFVEGYIMNSPFVAIVPLYALVVRRTVRWRRYRFADFTMLKPVSYIAVYVVTHKGVDPGAAIVTRPLQFAGEVIT